MKNDVKYNDYKKVLQQDLSDLQNIVMEAKHFEEFKSRYLDPSKVADQEILPKIKSDYSDALKHGDYALAFQLNSFLGTIKKINSRKKNK